MTRMSKRPSIGASQQTCDRKVVSATIHDGSKTVRYFARGVG
jgi:hypothetical protein